MIFNLQKTGTMPGTHTANYASTSATATFNPDFTATSETLTFLPSEASKMITVATAGDATTKSNETVLNEHLGRAPRRDHRDIIGAKTAAIFREPLHAPPLFWRRNLARRSAVAIASEYE
ncbi:hypothetical protein NDN01_02580 [Sphingomonas sp. QA11]|uniref:Calx-beta domain-containing protein n=1 Tax=Sphingomonas sp. QA11 TaxID=2950605 RepID=UPI002349034A|nr:Calx-beta domain-containing protein [Sphingomonas sp. QA11]WCM27834.1 hypothetical protein NDN01_02580 [Sphingomonas sp. QA11]